MCTCEESPGVTCDDCSLIIARAKAPRPGDYVKIWFDTGAMGATMCYGIVVSRAPKSYLVRWESGLTNRVRYLEPRGVKYVSRSDVDPYALARLEDAT